MIDALVVVPGAPALVRGLMGAAASELDGLREAARTAVLTALESLPEPPRVVVLGPADGSTRTTDRSDGTADGSAGSADGPLSATAPGRWAGRVSAADFGLPLELPGLPGAVDGSADPAVPTALIGARWVLGEVADARPEAARWSELTWHPFGATEGTSLAGVVGGPVPTLLVLALDGAASHGPKAPRAEQPGAAAYHDSLVSALGSGDPARLVGMDAGLGEEVGAAAPELWGAVGRLLEGRPWAARVCWEGHPYGVGYVVAVWTSSAAGSASAGPAPVSAP